MSEKRQTAALERIADYLERLANYVDPPKLPTPEVSPVTSNPDEEEEG